MKNKADGVFSPHSPKNKFSVEINFEKALRGVGSVVGYTAPSLSACMAIAARHTSRAHVVIRENKQTYPEFDWQTVKEYKINF